MIKRLTIGVIVIIAALAVAGCTTLITDTGTSPSPSATRDPQLVQYIDAYTQTIHELHPHNLTTYRVTWNNSTAVQVQEAFTYHPSYSNTTNITFTDTATVIKFSSVAEAAKYVDSHTSGYRVTMDFPTNTPDAYTHMTGHAPIVYSYHDRGPEFGRPGRLVIQLDEYVWVGEYRSFSSS